MPIINVFQVFYSFKNYVFVKELDSNYNQPS